jgi:hypothetical protein
MWLYFMIAFVEYVIVSMVISVDAYESKSRKRCKRLGKMIVWGITAGITYYLSRTQHDYAIYFLISCFLVLKYAFDIISPHLGNTLFTGTVYGGIGWILWVCWYEKHPIIIVAIIGLLIITFLYVCKENLSMIKQGIDADILFEEKYQANLKKKKRKRFYFKLARFAFKIYRM